MPKWLNPHKICDYCKGVKKRHQLCCTKCHDEHYCEICGKITYLTKDLHMKRNHKETK